MKRIIIVGASGYLGTAVTGLASKTYKVLAMFRRRPCPITSANIDHSQLDFRIITTVEAFQNIIRKTDLVLVASNVEYEHPDDITLTNYEGFLRILADRGIKTVYVSSDAIFDGKQPSYTEESVPNPITDYGKRKLRAERIIGNGCNVIIRTSYLYGSNGYAVDKRLREFERASINDKMVFRYKYLIRNPIHVRDLANILLLLKDKSGIFHAAGSSMSVYDFSRFLAEEAGTNVAIKEVELGKQEAVTIPMNTNLVSVKLQGLGITIPSMEENRGRVYMSFLEKI
ncbi:MAG TPA: sugar nucleotide-binding protein [Desulfosporosinus sp.]|nr:sugar nucleotide-binding protein [Desulfosporosinus sp.]